jgi:O-antigen/teichoic acid export membrane protein
LSTNLVGGLASLGVGFVLGRTLGPAGTGVYFLGVTVITILSSLCLFGLDTVVLRESSVEEARGSRSGAFAVFRSASAIVGAISGGVAVALFLGAPWLASVAFSSPPLAFVLRVMAVGLLPLSFIALNAAFLRGIGKVRAAVVLQSVLVPLLTIPFLFVLARWQGTAGAAAGYLIAVAFVFASSMAYLIWSVRSNRGEGASGSRTRKALVGAGAPLFAIGAMQLVLTWSDILAVGHYLSDAQTGAYALASRTVAVMNMVLLATNLVVAPMFAALYASGHMDDLARLSRRISLVLALCTFPMLLLFAIASKSVLRFYGPGFGIASGALAILSIGNFINNATGPNTMALMMSGRVHNLRTSFYVSALLAVGLQILLVPRYGLDGAAVATASAVILKNLWGVAIVRRDLGFWIWPAW